MLDPRLTGVLVDPDDKGPLLYDQEGETLYNPRSRRRYAIHNSKIPVLLVDEAQVVSDEEHERLLKTLH